MTKWLRLRLAYGREGLDVDLPEGRTTVIEPRPVKGLPDEKAALLDALRRPLGSRPLRGLASRARTVAVAVCDVTRAIPSHRILPVVLDELEAGGARDITVLVATGTHRECTREELEAMLSRGVLDRCRVVNHNCLDESTLLSVGSTSRGTPIRLNRLWLESDLRVTTGFVEPHFFAGFSGGPKLAAPGLAALETVLDLHSAELIADPRSTWGVIEGNPIQGEIREIARRTGIHFTLDVTINRKREITGVFAGEVFQAHAAACAAARETAMCGVDDPFDVVVTTNSGYPLDLNLYQSVKGMSAAARVVRPGGVIVCASECSDGVPDHGRYGRLLSSSAGPEEILAKVTAPGFRCRDQWQAQIQAQIQLNAKVYLKSDGLSAGQIRGAHLEPVEDVGALVRRLLDEGGSEARVCVLPEGPQTIPFVREPGREPSTPGET
jgi:lactate racemase